MSRIKQTASHIYDVHYKKLMFLSFAILALCLLSLAVRFAQTGEFFAKGVSLKGGITMQIPLDHDVSVADIQKNLAQQLPTADIEVRDVTQNGHMTALIVEAGDTSIQELESALPNAGVPLVKGSYNVENMGSALGNQFFTQTIKAVLFAFLAMAIAVFITFRSLVPSSFVVLAAISDILSTLAVINILGVKLSTAGIAAFLMLIGYSVDTDILLTTIVLKRKGEGGTIYSRTVQALSTGIFLTLTALAASLIGFFFSQADTVRQIMLIVSIGLVFDMIYTWLQNAGILRLYLERKEHVKN